MTWYTHSAKVSPTLHRALIALTRRFRRERKKTWTVSDTIRLLLEAQIEKEKS